MKLLFHIFFLSLSAVMIISCRGTKQAAKTKERVNQSSSSTGSLDEKKRVEFETHFFEGLTQKSLDNPEEARKAFLNCIAIDPGSASAHYELSRQEFALGNLPASHIAVKKATELDRNNLWFQLMLADVSLEMGMRNEAIKSYEQVLRIRPEMMEIYFHLAQIHSSAQQYSEAISVLNRLEKVTGFNEELTLHKISLLQAMKKDQEVEKELLRLTDAYPGDSDYLSMLYEFYLQTGMTLKAEAILAKLATATEKSGQVHLLLADNLKRKGRDKEAFQELKMAFASPELSIDSKISILLTYYDASSGDVKATAEAYELLTILEEIHPSEAKTFSIYGDFLFRDARDEEALRKYYTATELDPNRHLLWLQLLEINSSLGRFADMERDARSALEYFPTVTTFYLYHGLSLMQLKRHEEALEPLRIGKELIIDDPGLSAQFYSLLGDALHSLGRHDESDQAYEDALTFDPDNVFVLNNFSYYLSIRKKNLDKALVMIARAVELSPGSSSFEDTYAWVLFRSGKYQEAETRVRKALEYGGSRNGVILEHYGDILYFLGRQQEAVDYWKKAKSMGGASSAVEKKIETGIYLEENE